MRTVTAIVPKMLATMALVKDGEPWAQAWPTRIAINTSK